jgi:hypothetical protein
MSVTQNAKELADLIKTLGDTDLYKRIVELEGEIIDLSRVNHHLVQRNAELEAQLQTKGSITFDELQGVYSLMDGETQIGPYCQLCHDADKKLIRLQDGGGMGSTHRWTCYACKRNYGKQR